MCRKLDTELLQGLENALKTTDLAQMQKPQPVNPELPSWPVSAFLHVPNTFSVNNVLSRTATVHHAILDDASVMSEDDHPATSRQSWGPGAACAMSWGDLGLHLREALLGAGRGTVLSWVLQVCKSILTSDTSISIGAEEAFFLYSTKVCSVHHLPTLSSVCEKASG